MACSSSNPVELIQLFDLDNLRQTTTGSLCMLPRTSQEPTPTVLPDQINFVCKIRSKCNPAFPMQTPIFTRVCIIEMKLVS
jgi:hypothetical protein